ncbi:MAG: AMIN domain-containing protein [Deltaproteobacteria bacterium]|nr:AMIN domain-containing protein [Deltaproteobacteria bacterium]
MKHFLGLILFLALLSTPFFAYAQERLLELKDPQLSFQLSEQLDAERTVAVLKIEAVTEQEISTLLLEDPLRVVIDLPPTSKNKHKTFALPKSKIMSALRMGSHADKLRLVADLRGQAIPRIVLNPSTEGVTIELVLPAIPVVEATHTATPIPVATVQIIGAASEATATPTGTSVSQSSATPTATATATATSEPSPAPTLTPTATTIPNPTASPTAASLAPSTPPTQPPPSVAVVATGSPHLINFSFEYTNPEHAPFVRIELSDRTEFKLSKIEDRLYKLTIPGAQLATLTLKLPQFPPHDFVGLTFLQADQLSDSVEVKIGVSRGSRISALPQDKDIVIKVLGK